MTRRQPWFPQECVGFPSHPLAENLDEVLHESWNIFSAFTEGWQRDRKNVEPVIEVTAEFVPRRHFQQISIRGSHQPHVHLMGAPATQALELLLLKYPQQFRLQRWRDIPDLVQE